MSFIKKSPPWIYDEVPTEDDANRWEDGIESANNPSYSTTQISSNVVNSLPSTSQGLLDEMLVKGRTTVNLFPDPRCESTAGWTAYRTTVTTDSGFEFEGTNCLRITKDATGTNGNINRDILSLLNTSKYYLVTARIKTVSATNISLGVDCVGDVGVKLSSTITVNTYTRVGVILQPSDFDTATNVYLYLDINGASTQYAHVDTLQVQEISASDYALGVTALLLKYTWHLGTKSVDKMRVKTVGKNLLPTPRGGVSQNGITVTVDENGIFTVNGTASADTRITLFGNIVYGASSTDLAVEGSPIVPMNSNISISYSSTSGSKTGTSRIVLLAKDTSLANTTGSNLTLGTAYNNVALSKDVNTVYMQLQNTSTYSNYKFKVQIEYGATGTTFEVYNQSQSVCTLPLRSNATTQDTWDAIRGIHTQKVDGSYVTLATPIITYLQSSVLQANASGTILQERFVEDYGWYNSGLALTDVTKPIISLVEVRKWDTETSNYTIIPNPSVTITAGVITAISGAVPGEFYTFDYVYDDSLSLTGELNYSYATNMAGQVQTNTENIALLDKKIDLLEKTWKLYDYGTTGVESSTLSIAVPNAKFLKILVSPLTPVGTGTDVYLRLNNDTGNNYGYSCIGNSSSIRQSGNTDKIILGTQFDARYSTMQLDITQRKDFNKTVNFSYSGGNTGDATGGGFGGWTNTTDMISTVDLSFSDTNISTGVSYEVYYCDG